MSGSFISGNKKNCAPSAIETSVEKQLEKKIEKVEILLSNQQLCCKMEQKFLKSNQ